MKVSFDIGKWWGAIYFNLCNFDVLLDYVYDEEALDLHSKKYGILLDPNIVLVEINKSKTQYSMTEEQREHISGTVKKDISEAFSIYYNQIIVFSITILENILKDFYTCIFINNPNEIISISKVVDNLYDKLGFSLKEFLSYSSKEEYVNELANRAANICISGSIEKIFKRINKLTPISIDRTTVDFLVNLYDRRTKIVHERCVFKVDKEFINSTKKVLDETLMALSKILKSKNVDLIDQCNWINQ